jgi:phospholipase C
VTRSPRSTPPPECSARPRGYVDHTHYDTTSIIKLITRRFDLEPLPGVRPAAGDLTAAFDFGQ